MKAQEFIEKRLNKLKSTEQTVSNLKTNKNLADFIFKAVMSKKFRKFSISPDYLIHIRKAIESNIKDNIPIQFVFPFGGYKLWRLEETPEVDWAELFTLMHYTKWLKPIAEVYKPGVWLDFYSDDVIVERMNNIPKSDTEKYSKSLNMLFNFMKKYVPENIKFTMTPVSSFYTPEEFEEDLEDKIETIDKELGGLPTLNEKVKKAIELNVRLKPNQDKDPLWREKVELLHLAYYEVDRRLPYSLAEDKILTFCMKPEEGWQFVSIGTTKTSIAKFWAGVGVLKKRDDSFIESILSPNQLKKSKTREEGISINGLEGKNFKKIKISD